MNILTKILIKEMENLRIEICDKDNIKVNKFRKLIVNYFYALVHSI